MSGNNVRIGVAVADNASSPIDRIRDKFQKLQKQGASGIITGIAAGATVAALGEIQQAAGQVVDFVGHAIQEASNLNETINKSSVVFGQSAGDIKAWGEQAATSMGLSENAAIGAASTIGNLLLSTGTAPEKIAPMSKSIVQLASDLASFNNISTDDALAKLQSGLVGQERPLRELGVAISAASVDAEALALGFKKINGQFTEGEKVQARYSLIFKQTTTAQGDFARTSDQLANSQRIVSAEWDDAVAHLGQALIPAVTSLAHITATELIPALVKAADWIGSVGNAAYHWAVPVVDFLNEIHKAAGGSFGPPRLVESLNDTGKAFVHLQNIIHGSDQTVADLNAMGSAVMNVHDSQQQLNQAAKDGQLLIYNAAMAGKEAWAQAQRAAANGVKQIIKIDYAGGRDAALALAQGLESERNTLDQTWQSLIDGLKHPMTHAKEVALLDGRLLSGNLAKGFKSGDQELIALSRGEVDGIVVRFEELIPQMGGLGRKAIDALKDAEHSKIPEVRRAAKEILDANEAFLNSTKPWHQWGLSDAQAFALGLSSGSSLKGAEVAGEKLMAAALAGIVGSVTKPGKPGHPKPKPTSSGSGGSYDPNNKGPLNARGAIGQTNGPMDIGELGIMGEAGGETYALLAHPQRLMGGLGGGDINLNVHIHSALPPSPAQAQQIGREIVPLIVNELVRRGIVPRRPTFA